MKVVLLLSLLLVVLLTIDQGESWRRRRRGGGWVRKVYKAGRKVYKFYKRHKRIIHAGVKVGSYFIGKDSQDFANLATLKANDRESYLDVMEQLRAIVQNQYPEEDADEVIEFLDEAIDMQPDELEMLLDETDFDADTDESLSNVKDFSKELADRVAAIKVQQ